MDQSDEENLIEEKKRLESILKEMSQKTEDERNAETVKLLKEYNAVKDAVQELIGALATTENVTVGEIHERLNLSSDD